LRLLIWSFLGKKKLLLNAREIFQGDKESNLILLAIQRKNVKEKEVNKR